VDDCRDKGCKFIVDKNFKYVILKGEKLREIVFGKRHSRLKACDCIIFTEDHIIVVELEKKVENFEEYAKAQLSKCAKMVEEIIEKCEIKINDSKIYFVLVCKYWKDKKLCPSRDKHRLVVRFRGKDRNVILKSGSCKAYLREIVEKFKF
jgi:hypothetical protein